MPSARARGLPSTVCVACHADESAGGHGVGRVIAVVIEWTHDIRGPVFERFDLAGVQRAHAVGRGRPVGRDARHRAHRAKTSATARPRRLFTVWFAPQVNMTGVFTGALAIVLGLGFWLGLLAMVIGTVLGSLVVGYLSTWGPRTGTAQLPNSRMAFGGGVVLPAALQWLSSIAWDALVGLFGGEALAVLLGIPFWIAVLIVLGVQGVVGFFGYELIHRMQAVLTVVLFVDLRGVRGQTRRRASRSSRLRPCTGPTWSVRSSSR